MNCLFVSIVLSLFWSVKSETALGDTLKNLLSAPFSFSGGPDEYSCPIDPYRTTKLNDFHIRGTALGGWMVLEPWLTPSLFYQFLGASQKWGDDAKNRIAIDSKTFCTALGPEEANRQLRNHWKTWVDEDQIRRLAQIGVKTLRIPVADWMYVPYEPFIGCWDGALEEVDRVLDLCEKYGINALIDLHAVRYSQNGLDNSGDTSHFSWISNASSSGVTRYEHWNMRGGDWIQPMAASINVSDLVYMAANVPHILDTLQVINAIVDRYKDSPVVMGLEPVNEPWDQIPLPYLKQFYWRAYRLVQLKAPHWVTLLHDSFRLTRENFGSFMQNCDMYALDTHIYQAWAWENSAEWFQLHACLDRERLVEMESIGVPIIVGEWSLATDNCAMWLNGLNDNVPGYPKVVCEMVECPAPYMGAGVQPGAPPDKLLPAQDPFGAGGISYVEYGMCPRDRPFPSEHDSVRTLSYNKLHAFDHVTHGQFFWNFRTEFETRWDYQRAVELGWIPTDWENRDTLREIKHSCDAFLEQVTGSVGNSSVVNSTALRSNMVLDVLRHNSPLYYYFVLYLFLCVALMCVVLGALRMKSSPATITSSARVSSVYNSVISYMSGRREGYVAVPDQADHA